MASKLSKIINTKKTPLFWAYIAIGAVVVAVSVLLMPFWLNATPNAFFATWGYRFVQVIIAIIVLLYACLYLLKKIMKRSNGVVKILSIIEFAVLILVALGLVLSQLAVFALDASHIIALVLWMRGVVEIFRAFYGNKSNEKYPVSKLAIAVILATIGAYFFASGFVTNTYVLWVVTIFGVIFGLITFLLGFYKKPAKKSK